MKNAILLVMATVFISLSSCGDDKDADTDSAASALIGTYEGSFYPGTAKVVVNITSAGGENVDITFEGTGKMPAPVKQVSARWADGSTVQVVSPLVMYYKETGKIQISEYTIPVYQFNGVRK